MAINSLYCQSKVWVLVNGKQSKSFQDGVGLRQGCVLSYLRFIIYMNWMDKLSRTDESITIGKCKIIFLFFLSIKYYRYMFQKLYLTFRLTIGARARQKQKLRKENQP